MSLLDTYRYDGTKKFDIKKAQTDSHCDKDQENKIIKLTGKNIEKISELQDKFYADAKESIVLVLQAMDAAGKDGTVKHVMSGLNPQGVDVFSFKTPNSNEAAHDFLWRYHRRMPVRGKMALFNRSWYEEVLIVKVHDLYKDYHMADRCIGKNFFKMKYDQITAFEKHLYENSYRIVKIFLNVSKEEQKKRFLERLDKPGKNWKFSENDLKERQFWPKYQQAFEDAINATAKKTAPWFVLPADQKWYTHYLVSEILLDTLKKINPEYPQLSEEEKGNLENYRNMLKNKA